MTPHPDDSEGTAQADRPERVPLLDVRELGVRFGAVRAVDGVSFAVPRGRYGLGIVGESGSGKTTIGRALMRLVPVDGGTVRLDGRDVLHASGRELRAYRRSVQIVFQDPDGTLDPRVRVGSAIAEGMLAHGHASRAEARQRVEALLREVDVDPGFAGRFPHQLSGGQRQRVAIARALAVEPRLLILDEPTSALDVTVQARILRLIGRLRDERGLAYVLISHNLAIVEQLCDETVVLYLGRVVERGPTAGLLGRPAHPYTVALRSAVPRMDRRRRARLVLSGPVPDPAHPPAGCPFHPRCPIATDVTRSEVPELRRVGSGPHLAACHRAEDVLEEGALDART